jgi:hypothetical protein
MLFTGFICVLIDAENVNESWVGLANLTSSLKDFKDGRSVLEYEGSTAGDVGVESVANESPSKKLKVTLFLIFLV